MAVFLMAKFLSEALAWKYKHPEDKVYPPKSNIKYEPFIFEKARKIFSDYSSIYPKNEDFTAKIAQDLQARNIGLIKIINPEIITPEMKTANKQFQVETKFDLLSLQVAPIEVVGKPPSAKRIPPQPINQYVQDKVATEQTPNQEFKPQLPQLPTSFGNTVSRAGKYLTFERVVPAVFGTLGGVAGWNTSGGNPLAAAAGATGGAIGSSYLTSPEGRNLLGRIGRGTVDAGVNTSNKFSRGNLISGPPKRVWLGAVVGFLILFFIFGGVSSSLPIGTRTPTGEAAPVPGNVGIGNTTPVVNVVSPVSSLNCTSSMSVQDVNNYFQKNGYYNFYNTGQTFLAAAQTYNINPALIIAIGSQESALGNVYKGKPSESTRNAFGLMQNNSLMRFSSWEEGINIAFKSVASYKCSTIECIGQKYAPVGAANDPSNYNKDWIPGVTKGFNTIPQATCLSTSIAEIKPDRPSGWPTTGKIMQGPFEAFSHKVPPQNALDIANEFRTPIYSTLNGTVKDITYNDTRRDYGVNVVIANKDTGSEVLFGHMIPQSNSHLQLNQAVSKGDLIGLMGSTGNSTGSHLHYELRGGLSNQLFSQFVPGGNILRETIVKIIGNLGEWLPRK